MRSHARDLVPQQQGRSQERRRAWDGSMNACKQGREMKAHLRASSPWCVPSANQAALV